MHVFAIFFVLISSDGTIWYVPLFPGGTYKERSYDKHSSSILKPLSAIIVEYIGKYWLFSVSFLSDIAPLHAFETNYERIWCYPN